jgi:small multidrug resistance pump
MAFGLGGQPNDPPSKRTYFDILSVETNAMGYAYLILTIFLETAAVLFMKSANGFERKLQSGIAVAAYLLSFYFLTLALKRLPMGTANAVWAGASTVLVAVLGVWLFKETLTSRQVFFLALIVVGLIGLHWE